MVTVKKGGGKESKMSKLIIALSISSFVMMVIVILIAGYVFYYSQKNNKVDVGAKPVESTKVIEAENKNLSASEIEDLSAEEVAKRISKHILLSEGEITVVTVTNIEGLRTDYPELFLYAKNGDRLLFYQLGIIIYDPVLDKIVDVLRRLPKGTYIPNSPDDKN